MRIRTVLSIALLLVAAGCSAGDPTASDEYAELERQLTAAVAERDALAAQLESETGRRDRAREIIDEILAILDDSEACGTEDEVADIIATPAAETAVMDDDVFGPYGYRDAFCNTLYYVGAAAELDAYASWISDDGSQGGCLWMWSGTNPVGYPFEVAGISPIEYADDGRIAYERVTYPYPDEYVRNAWLGRGTEILSTG